jgi:glycosyltransferase involved in cell wall biosynthesis
MKILILNWRDIKNPSAGGSETYFHELAKRFAKLGNSVTILCGGWKGCKKEEIIDDVLIKRIGSAKTLYLLAPFAYLKLKEKPDIIIDVENGIPFFTPFYSRAKKILHIHHVHKDVWFRELNPVFGFIGWFLENKIMPLVYRRIPVITISQGSKIEIEENKFGKVIGVVNPGIEFVNFKKIAKTRIPSILFLNRIKKYKGLDVLLKAVKILNKKIRMDVFIAGDGDYLLEMKNYAFENNLTNVHFLGRVSEEKKKELMQKSWIFVNPSFKEGWGIVNIEANYYGTPAIGSNVSGIKDSIVDGKTGLLFEYGNPNSLAEKIHKLINNKNSRNSMIKNAKKWAKKFDYDIKANEYLNFLKKVILR